MNRRHLLPLTLLLATACASSTAALPPQRFVDPPLPEVEFTDPARRAKIEATFPELDAYFAGEFAKAKVPGLAVGVVVDGDLAWSKGYGLRDVEARAPVDADTVFRIGSMGKTLAATAIMQLRDAGKLALGDPAERYLPELSRVVYLRRDAPRMTIWNLLTHSSGLPEWGPYSFTDEGHEITEAEVRRTFPNLALVLTTGAGNNYSNEGIIAAGFIAESVSGIPYRQYVTERIFRPLGMTASVWNEEDVPRDHFAKGYAGPEGARTSPKNWRIGATVPAGGAYSSVRDLARFVAMQLSAWEHRDRPDDGPVRRASLREMHLTSFTGPGGVRMAGPDSPWLVELYVRSQGLGWESFSDCDFERIVNKGGAEEDGYAGFMAFVPGAQVGLVALWNMGDIALFDTMEPALRMLGHKGGIEGRKAKPAPGLQEAKARLDHLLAHWDKAAADRLFAPLVFDAISNTPSRADWDKMASSHGACRARDDLEVWNGFANGHWTADCDHGRIELEVDVAEWSPLVVREYRFSDLPETPADSGPGGRCPRKPTPAVGMKDTPK
jgi:CubicO group peptidase (beta-lactamase class C family)